MSAFLSFSHSFSSPPLSSPRPRRRVSSSFRVSSVLNDSREYGKQNLFDGLTETCWNSGQGTPQFIQLSFQTPVELDTILITFQGGFVGKSLVLSATSLLKSPKKFQQVHTWEPNDINIEQRFELPRSTTNNELQQFTNIKLTFPTSTDFYGRITIYKLDLIGRISDANETNAQASSSTSSAPAPAP